MVERSSYRHILRATAILGSSSLAQILIGIVKIKALALLAGPAGVGLVGVYSAVLNLSTSIAGLGVGQGAVRELAAARSKGERDLVRHALFAGSFLLGGIALVVLAAGSGTFSRLAFSTPDRATEFAWIGAGTFVAVIAGAQAALLNGLHRVRELAILGASTSLLAAIAGVAIVWFYGETGALAFVLAVPVVSLVVGTLLCRTVEPAGPAPERRAMLAEPFARIVQVGFAMSVAAIVGNVAQVVVRAEVTSSFGIEAAGHLQASWTISTQYIGFLASAMALDFYPRLSAAAEEPSARRRLVNEQTELTLLIAGPALLATFAFAPLVIRLLYSADFAEAAGILRWQVVGDLCKLASWPLGFLFLARRRTLAFVATDVAWAVTYVALVHLTLPAGGVAATGGAFALAYAGYLVVMLLLARTEGVGWSRICLLAFAANAALLAALVALERFSPELLVPVGVGLAGLSALGSLATIRHLRRR